MMYLTQALHRNAQIHGNRLATVCAGRRHTWRELLDRVGRSAAALRGLGLRPGDRVAILSLNSDRYFECYYAVPWAGGMVVPLNIRWSAPENIYALQDSDSSFLFIDNAFAPMAPALRAHVPALREVIFIGEGPAPEGMHAYEALLAAQTPEEDAYRRDDDLAGIFYTGGTMGFPKGVMISHGNLWSNTMAMALEVVGDAGGNHVENYLHAAPMFHAADLITSQAITMLGRAHHFVPFFTPEGVLQCIERERVDVTLLVPTMIRMLLDDPAFGRHDLSSLRFVGYGASPIPEATLREAMTRLPGVKFAQGYGQTELSPLVSYLPSENHVTEGAASKLRSAGRANFCSQIRIVDGEGRDVPAGTVGEVAVRGPGMMKGYWNKPKETAEVLREGWIHTGDAGYMDEEGFLFLVDRVKDMIVSGGENVYSSEVENALVQHPAVSQAVVIGVPDGQWGERVHAIVILREGLTATEEDLIAHCHTFIANYKCPRSIEFRAEPFPMSGAGKILKRELRKPYWAEADRMIH